MSLSLGIVLACPSGKRCQGRPTAFWRDYSIDPFSAGNTFGIPQEVDRTVEERIACTPLLNLDPPSAEHDNKVTLTTW